MTVGPFLAPALAAGFLSFVLTPLAGRLAMRIGAVDYPGPRKIHQHPIPRLGGVAVITAVTLVAIASWFLMPAVQQAVPGMVCLGIALGVLPIVAVSLRDDVKPLRPGQKFAAHVLGACIAVACGVCLNGVVHLFGYAITIGWLAFPLSVIWLVGMTNAFNIVDGLDGLAAGLALISAFALAGLFLLAGQPTTAGAALLLAGGIAGFLPYNRFPARMFFGDTGAAAVGFILATFALRGGSTLSAGFATLVPTFILGLPLAETLLSMLRRLLRRSQQQGAGVMFEADRNHMHHRLLALGIDHPRAVLILYGVGGLLGGVALASMFMNARDSALLIVALLLAGFLGVHRLRYDEFAIIRNGVALRAYEVPALNRSSFIVFVDILIVTLAAFGAVMLKTDHWSLASARGTAVGMIEILAPITVIVFWRMKMYRGTWRLAATYDFAWAFGAVFIAALLGLTVRLALVPQDPAISLFAIYLLLSAMLVIGSRASYQVLVQSRWRSGAAGTPALIYGAGRKGVTAVRELVANAGALRPVAFIDDDPKKAGRLVKGLPVVGSVRYAEAAIRQFDVRSIIVASEAVPESRLAELRDCCERLGVDLLKLQINFASVPGIDVALASVTVAPEAAAERETAGDRVPDRLRRSAGVAPAANLRFEEAPGANPPIVPGQQCPSCSAHTLYRSKVRKLAERVRKKLTDKRLYRCQSCGWRGWTQMLEVAAQPSASKASKTRTASWLPSLDAVDKRIHKTPMKKRAS